MVADTKFLDKINLDNVTQLFNYMNDVHYIYIMHGRYNGRKCSKSPPKQKKLVPSKVEAPSLKIKHLQEDLMHAFLGPKETFPVVISTDLQGNQEERLLSVLYTQKLLWDGI